MSYLYLNNCFLVLEIKFFLFSIKIFRLIILYINIYLLMIILCDFWLKKDCFSVIQVCDLMSNCANLKQDSTHWETVFKQEQQFRQELEQKYFEFLDRSMSFFDGLIHLEIVKEFWLVTRIIEILMKWACFLPVSVVFYVEEDLCLMHFIPFYRQNWRAKWQLLIINWNRETSSTIFWSYSTAEQDENSFRWATGISAFVL